MNSDDLDKTVIKQRTEYIIARAAALYSEKIEKDVAEYMVKFKNEFGNYLQQKDINAWLLRAIAFSSFTNRSLDVDLLKEVKASGMSDSKLKEILQDICDDFEERDAKDRLPQKYSSMFDPKSELEIEAYRIYENKFGHIPIKSLTEEQAEGQQKIYFEILEFFKKERIRNK